MWRPLSLLMLALALAACATTSSVEAANRPTGPRIVHLDVVGNQHVSGSLIKGRIATRASNRFLFFGAHHYLDEGAVAQDLRRIRDIYEEQGFYGASVDVEIQPVREGEVRVVFQVEEGPPTMVRSLVIQGLGELSEESLAEILDDAPLATGERLVEADYLALKKQVEDRLRSRGYATARVDGRIEVAPAEGDADVVLAVSTGEVYRFGDIDVVGNLLIPTRRILESSDFVLSPGKIFSPEAMTDAQSEIFGLGAFSAVTLIEKEPDREAQLQPVTIAVNEADFLRLRFGAGVGIDQSYYQTRIIAEVTHLNLFGGLQRLQFTNELAYRFVSASSQALTNRGIAGTSSLELTQPDWLGPRIDLATRVRYERELTPTYTSQSISGRIGTPIRFRRWLYLAPTYNIVKYFDVGVLSGGNVQPISEGSRASIVGDCPTGCTLSYLEQRLVADRRNDPVEPHWGWYAALGLQEGGLGGSFAWIRVTPEIRGYFPLAKTWVLATRLELGTLHPISSCATSQAELTPYLEAVGCTPVVVRLFGGGANDFRGVGADRLGPVEAVLQNGRIRYVPLGGDSSLLATGELRWFFGLDWSSSFFLDLGSVEAGPWEAFRPSNVQPAVGSGLRYKTPVGPARLDVAWRFLQEPTFPVNGGRAVEKHFYNYLAIFLSLGEAF